MALNCSPLLVPPCSIPSLYPHPPPEDFCQDPSPPIPSLLSPPPVPSVDTRRLLISSARRRETADLRERWKNIQQFQHAKSRTSSRIRVHPLSAPSNPSSSSSLLDLRKHLTEYGLYGQSHENGVPCKQRPLQFPLLEQELTKRNLTQRLPYHVRVEVESEGKMDYPTHPPSYPQVFFFSAPPPPPSPTQKSRPTPTPSSAPSARRPQRPKSEKQERFFIHPEFASEAVEWKRFMHNSNPDRFRYSWM